VYIPSSRSLCAHARYGVYGMYTGGCAGCALLAEGWTVLGIPSEKRRNVTKREVSVLKLRFTGAIP